SDWSAGEVVEMYDIWLEPGDYNFHLERYPSGVADLDMALYYFDSPPYCGGRTDHFINARSQNIGNTVDESFWAPVSEAGWYGLVVSSRNNGYGEFRLHIHPDGSWSGDVSTDWHDPTNWHSGSVPNSSTDVIITAGRPNYPILEGASGYCDGLELKPGASLTLNHDLYVGGHAHIAGDLHMALTSAYLYASQHLYCEAGCDLDMAAGTEIRLSGNLIVEEGALVDPQAGSFIFEGFEGAGIQNHDNRTSFHNIENHKDYYPLHFSSFCTEDFTITGNLILLNNTTLEGDSPHRVTLNGGIYKLPGSFFYFEDGEFIFENSTSNLTPDPMDYFHNLTLIDSEISLQSDLYVNGDLNTISGNLNLWSYQLYLQGDWNNHAGAGVLGTTTTGTVAFYGIDEDQSLIGDTDIPTLLLQNWFGELYCPSGTINCENWHWSLGTLHIDGAVFTADDIVTSTLQGAYIVDAGELNLHQDETDYVDLNASIDISGGFMRVYGGYAIDSYWPYTQNASITMSGGVLDFVDNGIYLYDGAYTLTDIITGGTIRTGGNFTGLRHDFNPGGGTIELYGGSDAQLGHGIGSSFHDVLVNKGTAMLDRGPVVQPEKGKKNRKDVRDTMAEQIIRYRHDGSSYPVDRMSTVTVVSTLDIDDDLVFQDGFFVPDANVVDMDGDFDIYGTLMIDSEDYIRVGTDIFWRDGSQCSAQGGEIHCEGGWIFYDGCNVPLQSVVTVYMDGTGPGEIHNYSHSLNARFGELVIDKFQGGRVSLAESGYPIEAVQLRCTPSDTIFGGSSTLEVDSLLLLETGSAFIGGNGGNVTCDDITIAGLLDLGEGILTVHDNFLLDAGGSLNLAGGQVLCDRAYTGNFMSIAGALNFSEGLFQVVNEGLQFGGGTYSNISGGIIRLGWGLRALYENGLQPSGGTVEFTGASYPTIECNNGNYLHDLTIDKSGGMVYTMYPLTLNGDLHLINRTLNAQGNDLTIGGDLLIEPGGQLDPDEGTVSVGLNWTNLRGAIGFIETNSSVTFTGDMPASINNAETFHNLNVDKPTAVGYFFEIPDALTIDVLGDLQLYTGPLMLHDAVTLDVAGDIHIYSGAGLCAYPLYNGIEIEIGGSLFNYNSTYDYRVGFNPGTSLVTFNGTGDQYIETWPTAEFWDLTIDKPSGTLIKDCNLWIQHDFNFLAGSWDSYNQPEVIHTFEGDLYQAAAADLFDPYATFYLTGTAEQLIDLQGSYQFADLILYKGEPVLQQVLTPSLAGKEAAHTEQERSEPVILQHDLTVSGGDLVIENGTLQLNGYTLTADGGEELTVYEDGILNLSPGSQLLLGDLMYLFVTGRLELLGSEAEPAVLSHAASGHYFCDITGGGTLSAEHALFEYMGTAGINIDYSGNLDPVHTLHHCTFQQGPMFGTLLQINTTQAGLVINGAHFPDNSWNGMFNVSRYLPQPPFETVTFAGATGGFAGVAWEDDPDGLIDWTSGGDPDLQVTDLYWSDTAPYVVDYVELHYTITNSGDAPSGQSTLGLYYDLAVPPTVGDTPDETLIISSIAPAEAFSSSIWVTSLDAAEWSSWLLADCLGEIVESNEGNNYGGPGAISWLPLPAVDDLEISYDPDYYMATLTWSYPIWVQYFNIYRGTTPYFTPGLENLIASQIETTYIDDDLPDEYFYQVTAVREWVVATGEELPLEQQIPLDR
ncbi:MAG: hypothetical protein ISR91_03825, partial [Candidatus Delongbacteria bacterium]|nr:hypothetical protein [Candidatus Delongbacteria bacterium]